jgi:hypothetical protein
MTVQKLRQALTARHATHTEYVVGCTACKIDRMAAEIALEPEQEPIAPCGCLQCDVMPMITLDRWNEYVTGIECDTCGEKLPDDYLTEQQKADAYDELAEADYDRRYCRLGC